MKKSYLSQQIRLMSITTYDLMTDDEYAIYMQLVNDINKSHDENFASEKQELIEHRRMLSKQLTELIARHDGVPRTVRMSGIINPKKYDASNMPDSIVWRDLRNTKQISEFLSEGARALGLEDLSITFDKVIVQWKNLDILKQITFDGFFMPIRMPDGSVDMRHYCVESASAAQLRKDKVYALSDRALQQIENLWCGMSVERINARGGINVNKLLAYRALPWSATDVLEDFNIDEALVVDDFETEVKGRMLYINNKYEQIKGMNSVSIKHTDGAGIYLPSAFHFGNVMVRSAWLKGLISPFDYIEFCRHKGVKPVIKDAWGKLHDVEAEGIKVLFTKSQLKLYSYYDSWDQFRELFKSCGCHMCLMNYEEAYIKDVPMNYQFLQQLRDMTNEEIDTLTEPTRDLITRISRDVPTMLHVLRVDGSSTEPYAQALGMYNELLREAYSKESLRGIKKRMILDGKSGRLLCKCKRLYAVPDWYAVCSYWFLGDKDPDGLLQADEVWCPPFMKYDEVDVLRSPSLYFEHNIMKVNHNQELRKWFPSNAIVTSCKSLISKVLQFD